MRTVLRGWMTGTFLLGTLCSTHAMPDENPFAAAVRTTEPVEAEQQLQGFSVPGGFRVELVAAEPQIAKPMNLATDARGRLWVSSSLEYPFAAAEGSAARDSIRILEDTDSDGLADRVTVFADGLNIPIGLLPYQDGVICFSIPNIWLLRDTDGDSVCDTREILYGPFDTSRDTHGMCNAFRMGDDGWVYACHGFNNRSEVAGRDGHRISLTSGSTFRFRPDGSRIELYTQGQVNPFGMAIDEFGDIYTADCHTKPVTLLLPGGCYESFGRPHDGLGYVPPLMQHLHGSTAIAALALGSQTSFPEQWQQMTFHGNVMTSRVNSNRLERRGSSVRAIEQPDFLSCADPWFRPVDVVAGADGALYIADFYNRIIGHYEVDLKHPGRDRFRGRIWRVSWEAADVAEQRGPSGYGPVIAGRSAEDLLQVIASGPEPAARLARDQLLTPPVSAETVVSFQRGLRSDSADVRRHCLRMLGRVGRLETSELQRLAEDAAEQVRVHVFRELRETDQEIPATLSESLLIAGMADSSPLVRRAASAAAAERMSAVLVQPLLRLLQTTELGDVHLRHSVRIALRNHLQNDEWLRRLGDTVQTGMDISAVADLSLAAGTEASAAFVADRLQTLAERQPERLPEYLSFASSRLPLSATEQVVAAVQERFADQQDQQLRLLSSISSGFRERQLQEPPVIAAWARQLTLRLLQIEDESAVSQLQPDRLQSWSYAPHATAQNEQNCWGQTRSRRCADGVTGAVLYSSFEAGEQRTGYWSSEPFSAPSNLSFFIAGHDGFPDQPANKANAVRLRDAADGHVLREVFPPRNDVAQPVSWDLQDLAGRDVRLELVDGDAATAYAWLAVGRFSLASLNPSDRAQRHQQAMNLVAVHRLKSFAPVVDHLLGSQGVQGAELASVCAAAAELRGGAVAAAIASVSGRSGTDTVFEQAIRSFLQSASGDDTGAEILERAMQMSSARQQVLLADQLSTDAAGSDLLAGMMERGRASHRLLLNPSIRQRMNAVLSVERRQQLDQMQAALPGEDASIDQLLIDRRKDIESHPGDPVAGAALFRKNCQVCHQLGGEGKVVGPNLDGIASRGLARMLEDVLAPGRNVDVAFRSTTIVTVAGKAYSGLARDLQPERTSITDLQGRETVLSNSEIEERVPSNQSPMPSNFAESLTAAEFRSLFAYLLTQKK